MLNSGLGRQATVWTYSPIRFMLACTNSRPGRVSSPGSQKAHRVRTRGRRIVFNRPLYYHLWSHLWEGPGVLLEDLQGHMFDLLLA